MKKPEVGMWYTFCCWEDLYEIKTQEEATDLAENIAEDDFPLTLHLYATKHDALMDLSGWASQEDLARIKELHGWERPSSS